MTIQTLGEALDLGPKEPTGCRYIHGDPKTEDWLYCQDQQKRGSSFCEDHHTACYRVVGSPEHKRDQAMVKKLRDEGKTLF